MGTIGSTLSGYYQLANLLSSGSGSSLTSSGSSSGSNTLQTLEQGLYASSASGTSGSDGYLLDLSPQAQQLLNSGAASTTGGSTGSSSNFVLTGAQQTAIENIVEKYKDAPLTQATFQEIQNALQAAGLAPQTLGAEDQVKSFNGTSLLLSALSGNYAPIENPTTSTSGEQTKQTNYLQSIVSLWKKDGTASSASGSSSSGSSVTATTGTGL